MRTLIAVLVFLSSADALAHKPPPGWRFPTKADVKGEWLEQRDVFPIPYHARADFNGDGVLDDAWILISEDEQGAGLFVFLSQKPESPRVIKIFSDDRSRAQAYAVVRVPPGKRSTFCGRVGDCAKGEPKSVTLRNPGFEFITLGTAAALYFWNRRTKSFSSVTTAD